MLPFLSRFVEGQWLLELGGAALTGVSLAAQGGGHGKEPVAPRPFTDPLSATSRIVQEQWVTFPRFVLSGIWLRALRKRSAP
jgi:hypothetical protein